MSNAAKSPVVLLIFDGWGIDDHTPGNAIEQAQSNVYHRLLEKYPHIAIDASGEAVGLPEGQMGNSEVGHLNMGAGRIVYQDLTKINRAIRTGEFYKNQVILDTLAHVKSKKSTLHLMGLVSDGGVHSSLEHLLALIDLAKSEGVDHVRVHAFLDGRDVPPRSAEPFLRKVEEKLLMQDYSQISTVSGRYYAMDRDKRWERVQLAYDAVVLGEGHVYPLSLNCLERTYVDEVNDEFVNPSVTDFTYRGIADGDGIFFFNFRPDRARQLTQTIIDPNFSGFERKRVLKDIHFASMTSYDANFTTPVAYPKDNLTGILAEVVSNAGLKQFHTAETEKYAHVTYFFNGGREEPFPGEDRKLIPSPKVATYDLQPVMSLEAVTDALVEAIESSQYQFIVANFANPDMVGHTGKLKAAIEAVEHVDQALGRVVDAVLAQNGALLVTADHGNIEKMIDEDGGEHTAHTTHLVPLILVSADAHWTLQEKEAAGERAGLHFALSSVAPTILTLLGLPIPKDMTSPSVLAHAPALV